MAKETDSQLSGAERPGPATAAQVVPSGQALHSRILARGIQVLGIGTFYLVILIFFSISAPNFAQYSNTINILSNVSVIGIIAIGQAICIISGGFDLSVSGTVPLGAVAYAAMVNRPMSVIEATLVVLAVGGAVGLANGLIITKLGINPLITTLGTLSIGAGLAFTFTNGITTPLKDLSTGIWGNTAFAGITYDIVALLALSLVSFLVLRYTVFGRAVYAIGGNREAARLAGIRVDLISTVVYVISGALGAFAGEIVTSQLLAGSATVGGSAALSSIAAVILGGAALTGGEGGIVGTLLGVLVLGTIADGMALMHVATFYQQVATGGVLLLAVGFGRLRQLLGGRS
jgi:ribose transport system permease protein